MPQYMASFLMTTLVMSAIAGIMLVLGGLFPNAFSAKLRYVIWLVILVGLLIPWRPVIGEGLVSAPIPVTEQNQYDGFVDMPIDIPHDIPADISILKICILSWGIIAVSVSIYHIWHYVRFNKTIRRWGTTVTDESILSVLKSVLVENGIGHNEIGLKVCGFVSSSMLTGFLHPVILLPDKPFDADELALIFRHEIIHYKRRDLFVKLLSVIAISVYWFNPVIYWLCAAIHADGEASCDETVLQDSDAETRRFYAEIIIGMIGGKDLAKTRLSTCFYGGKSSIKKRLNSIMDTTRRMKKTGIAAVPIVVALMLLSGSVFGFSKQSLPTSVESETSVVLQDISDFSGVPEQSENSPGFSDVPEQSDSSSDFSDAPGIDDLTPEPPATQITAEQAKEKAIRHVGGGVVTECKLDYEDGYEVYEIKIVFGNREYEMNINVRDGAISDYDSEIIKNTHNDGHKSNHGHDD